jgi:inorganic pyrophosphatase
VPIPAGDKDGSLNVWVETPRGSTAKYKYDLLHQVIRLSRPLPLGLCYPYDRGIRARDAGADGEPLDAMVIWNGSSYPGVRITARCIGVLRVEQKNLESGARVVRSTEISVAGAQQQ